MGLAAQNQVRNLLVGATYPDHASITELKSGSANDLACLSADGTVPAAGENFMLFKLNSAGVVMSSDIVNPSNVLYAKSIAYEAPTLGRSVISGVTVDDNTLYTVSVVIRGYGSLSDENEYVKKAFYKSAVGDNQQAIVDGLIASLNRNFSREVGATASENPYFSFARSGSGAGSTLVIEEKSTAVKFDKNKFTRMHLDFFVTTAFTTNPVQTDTAGQAGVGTGKQVAADEFYLAGETGDFMRGAGYPHNFDGSTVSADASASYNTIEIGFYEEGRDEAKKSKKSLTINLPFTNLAGNSVINSLIGDLNTVLGAGALDTLSES